MTHPAVYAITAGVAIGVLIFHFVTSGFSEQERPHGPRSPRPPKFEDWASFRADIDGDPVICTICLTSTNALTWKALKCSHKFHEKCLKENMATSLSCPNCRAPVQFA